MVKILAVKACLFPLHYKYKLFPSQTHTQKLLEKNHTKITKILKVVTFKTEFPAIIHLNQACYLLPEDPRCDTVGELT